MRYFCASRLFEMLTVAHGDGSLGKLLTQLAKTELLIIDDWGLDILTQQQRNDLLEVIEDRHGRGATLITSQLPSATGMKPSVSRRSLTPFSIACSITRPNCNSRANPCAKYTLVLTHCEHFALNSRACKKKRCKCSRFAKFSTKCSPPLTMC